VNGLKEPKGVVYVDIPIRYGLEIDVAKAIQRLWGGTQISLSIPANVTTAVPSSEYYLRLTDSQHRSGTFRRGFARFSHLTIKYKQSASLDNPDSPRSIRAS
jgi:hypothetical protein